MQFKKEIEESLEQIRILEECFRHARSSEILPISFFSTSYDIVRELAGTLHYIEQGQLKFMQEQFIANQISFLETTDLISKTKSVKKTDEIIEKDPKRTNEILAGFTDSTEEEQLKNSFFPEEKKDDRKDDSENIKILADTRKYMSLNDKFRFQREIFMGSAEEMNKVFDILNEFSIIEDTLSFIESQPWYDDSEIVTEFREFIEKRFS
ncbi:MAG: hypothetical protein FWD60_00780 [Candidatus Azobacteroides sp.]|nr:hypothetical protein [Candidatus Azobacteroides sp.]